MGYAIDEINDMGRLYTACVNLAHSLSKDPPMLHYMRQSGSQVMDRLQNTIWRIVHAIGRIEPDVVIRNDLFPCVTPLDKSSRMPYYGSTGQGNSPASKPDGG